MRSYFIARSNIREASFQRIQTRMRYLVNAGRCGRGSRPKNSRFSSKWRRRKGWMDHHLGPDQLKNGRGRKLKGVLLKKETDTRKYSTCRPSLRRQVSLPLRFQSRQSLTWLILWVQYITNDQFDIFNWSSITSIYQLGFRTHQSMTGNTPLSVLQFLYFQNMHFRGGSPRIPTLDQSLSQMFHSVFVVHPHPHSYRKHFMGSYFKTRWMNFSILHMHRFFELFQFNNSCFLSAFFCIWVIYFDFVAFWLLSMTVLISLHINAFQFFLIVFNGCWMYIV